MGTWEADALEVVVGQGGSIISRIPCFSSFRSTAHSFFLLPLLLFKFEEECERSQFRWEEENGETEEIVGMQGRVWEGSSFFPELKKNNNLNLVEVKQDERSLFHLKILFISETAFCAVCVFFASLIPWFYWTNWGLQLNIYHLEITIIKRK